MYVLKKVATIALQHFILIALIRFMIKKDSEGDTGLRPKT
ncbi:MAG: hypothetical protein KatS3mg083_465 [Candidatus Dojkabacteria bacterium]|nr:MAG: hypothetical protein KatS3mg083_465 [Candidatus Dojkabacteria bacterium]